MPQKHPDSLTSSLLERSWATSTSYPKASKLFAIYSRKIPEIEMISSGEKSYARALTRMYLSKVFNMLVLGSNLFRVNIRMVDQFRKGRAFVTGGKFKI